MRNLYVSYNKFYSGHRYLYDRWCLGVEGLKKPAKRVNAWISKFFQTIDLFTGDAKTGDHKINTDL